MIKYYRQQTTSILNNGKTPRRREKMLEVDTQSHSHMQARTHGRIFNWRLLVVTIQIIPHQGTSVRN